MSDLSADAARWADLIAGMPQRVASTAKTQADIAETYQGQIPLQQAQAQGIYQGQIPQAQAEAGYYGALGTKTQIDADMNRIILDRMRAGQQQGNTQSGYTGLPPDLPGGTTTPPTGGTGTFGPGTPPQPGETSRDRMAYAQPQPNALGAGSTALAMATPPPPPPQGGGITARYPGSFQTAQADTGVTSDVQPTTVVPGSATLAAGGPQPPPGAPLGFGGVNVGGGPLMFGQTTAQNVPPGSTQMGRQTPDTTPPFMQGSGAGEYLPELGKFVPRQLVTPYLRALTQGGPGAAEALQTIDKARTNYLLQQAYAATTPDAWNKAVEREYLAGYLSVQDYQTYHTHPELRVEAIRALQPEITTQQNNEMAKQGMSWSDTVHQYIWDTRLHAGARPEEAGWINMGNGVWKPDMQTANQIAARSGVPIMGPGGETIQGPQGPQGPTPQGPPGAPPPGPQSGGNANPFDTYAAAVHQHEGTSPTMGDYGFIPSTKVSVARKYLGSAVAGMTDDQIKAMPLSQEQQTTMLRGFTADNAVTLGQNGIRASGSNLGMAHYIGAQGVVNLTKVPLDMTMTEMERRGLLVPGTVAGNARELGGNTTVGGFIDWAHRQYGNDTLTADMIAGKPGTQFAGPGAGGGGGGGGPQPAATPGGGPGGGPGPGQYQGKPVLPAGTAEISTHNIQADNAAVDAANNAAISAQGSQRVVQDMLDRTPRLQAAGAFGPASEFRTRALAAIHGILGTQPMPEDLQKAFDKWGDFSAQPDREAFIKEATQLALQQEAAMPGVRSGIGLAAMIGKGTPSMDMQGDTVRELLNRMLLGHIMTQDYANGLRDHVEDAQGKVDLNVQRYDPAQRDYDREWTNPNGMHSAGVYLGAASLLTDDGKNPNWKAHLSPDQQRAAVQLAMRADPDWHPPGYHRTQ